LLIVTLLEKRLRSVFPFVLTFNKIRFIAFVSFHGDYLPGKVAPNGDATCNCELNAEITGTAYCSRVEEYLR
jgi:hypothetical protein